MSQFCNCNYKFATSYLEKMCAYVGNRLDNLTTIKTKQNVCQVFVVPRNENGIILFFIKIRNFIHSFLRSPQNEHNIPLKSYCYVLTTVLQIY